MGRDKARLRLPDGLDWLSWTVERLDAACEHTVIAGGARSHARPTDHHEWVNDGAGDGPVAGILGTADRYPDRALLVLACDLPLVSVDLLRHLAALQADWVVARHRADRLEAGSDAEHSRVEPLSALYSPAAVAALRRRVEVGRFDLHGLTANSEIDIAYVQDEALKRFGEPAVLFCNLNRPQDVEKFAAMRHNVYVRLRAMTPKN